MKTAQAQLDLPLKKRKPWDDATPVEKNMNLRMPHALKLKLERCAQKVPGARSEQRIVREAIEKHVAELLAKYDHD